MLRFGSADETCASALLPKIQRLDFRFFMTLTKGHEAMAGANTLEFNDGNFGANVLEADQPVLVDFWAEWCQPCKMLAATIDEVADTYQGKAKIGKIDIDNNKEVAMKFNIGAIPTVLIFKNGEIAKQFVGLTRKEDIVEAMDALV